MKQCLSLALVLSLSTTVASASTVTATFLGDVTGSRFDLQFDDSKPIDPPSPYYSFQSDMVIHWQTADTYPVGYQRNMEHIYVDFSTPGRFNALEADSITAGFPITLDFQGHNVYALAYGGNYEVTTLSANLDTSGIDTSKPGWAADLLRESSSVVFTASYYTMFEALGVSIQSVDAPLTIWDLYSTSSAWFDGIPYGIIANAVSKQLPDMNRGVSETMHLVSVSAIPEAGAVANFLGGALVVLGYLARRRSR